MGLLVLPELVDDVGKTFSILSKRTGCSENDKNPVFVWVHVYGYVCLSRC